MWQLAFIVGRMLWHVPREKENSYPPAVIKLRITPTNWQIGKFLVIIFRHRTWVSIGRWVGGAIKYILL